jgi:hypothetical protein
MESAIDAEFARCVEVDPELAIRRRLERIAAGLAQHPIMISPAS